MRKRFALYNVLSEFLMLDAKQEHPERAHYYSQSSFDTLIMPPLGITMLVQLFENCRAAACYMHNNMTSQHSSSRMGKDVVLHTKYR